LQRLQESVPIARSAAAPEAVHDLRVSAARLDVWLRMAGWRVLRDDLRWLRRQAARVREIDVVLAGSPPRLAPELERLRAQAHAVLETALALPRVESLLLALSLLPPLRKKQARDFVARQRSRVARRGRVAQKSTAAPEDLHRLRRAVRRLRYALEWTGSRDPLLEELQGALGELNDAAAGLRLIESLPESAALRELRAGFERESQRLRERALSQWRAAQEKIGEA